MNQQEKNRQIQVLFNKMASLIELSDEEYQKRIDNHISKENIKTTMEFVFPSLKRAGGH
jgi:hypothetical protein